MPNEQIENIIIIGSGPAGDTAALYSARADLNPLVIEGMPPGGQLTITTDVENYPGFPNGVQGPELTELFRKQAERFGARFLTGSVTNVDLGSSPFKLTIEDEKNIFSKAIIIATGATAKLLGLKSESRLMGRGVSACATCDGFFFKDKELIVVGGGDTAMEEATFLTKFASKIYIVHRRNEFRASKIMQQRVLNNEKIDVIWNSNVVDILGENDVTGVKLENTISKEISDMPIDGVFLAIGHKPNTDLFKNIIDLNESGYIITKNGTNTNIPGIFACGDVQDWIYRQAVTAAGTGCMAAIDAERFLEK
ncbi:MAG: thioredoxin-disulfide reductase [SAR202 cluster bacterium]|jgi:thioredoxin reductase (NADPH)|nr:thioredoxin-disulfide reductase [SAR202 cluster bacterium]|tara:strand:- start:449 stop:1375 length:927 start_codon:yes stop_codon:yes gene_type:complete